MGITIYMDIQIYICMHIYMDIPHTHSICICIHTQIYPIYICIRDTWIYCIYLHKYPYTHMVIFHIHRYIYTYTDISVYMHGYTPHTYIYISIYIHNTYTDVLHMHVYIRIYPCTYIDIPHIHTYMYKYRDICIYIHGYTLVHSYMHPHTHRDVLFIHKHFNIHTRAPLAPPPALAPPSPQSSRA